MKNISNNLHETFEQCILRHRDALAAKGLSTKPNFVAMASGYEMWIVRKVLAVTA